MSHSEQESYFRGLRWKLAIPVAIGSVILILYYYKLLNLSFYAVKKAFLYLLVTLPFYVLIPVPINRYLLDPVIRYLKGAGNVKEAEARAAMFPIYSALVSLGSWIVGGIGVVIYSLKVLGLPQSSRFYLFFACVSAGFAASFIHYHLMRQPMEKIRAKIAAEREVTPAEARYPILLKLLLSFTMLIALALVFFALLENTRTEEALRVQGRAVLQEKVQHWNNLLSRNAALENSLPEGMSVEKSLPQSNPDEEIASVRMSSGEYLVARMPIAPQAPLRREDVSIIAIIVFVVGVISYFAANDISRPLKRIRQATAQIASGNFDRPVSIITDDEVGDLANSVNSMAADLKNRVEQLREAMDAAQEHSRKADEANRELMKLDELKSDFLANISHELKAPLVSTKGYVDFILGGKLGTVNEKQTKGLTVARDNLNHLSRLITSLLDFSKVTSGMLKLHVQPCALKPLVESCLESVVPESKRKGKDIDFVSELPANLPEVYIDPDRIREVFLNLLSNAEKFTESGGRIKVSVSAPAEADDYLTVNIVDNGIGIPSEHQAKIFNRFYQVDSSSTRKYGGTGLGLAIVKEIMEAHKCKISVESGNGIGSKFTFTLPIYRISGMETRERVFPRKGKHHMSKLVEVVEDDANIGAIVKMLLEEEGFSVIQARNGEDALTIAREHHPDMITLDVYLPDINGFDLLTQLQNDERTHKIPVIMLSILVDKEKGFRLGAFDYLEKPIDSSKLRASIRRVSRLIDGMEGQFKIMVVDDDADTLEFLQDCLAVEGYEMCTHQGGKGALAAAARELPNLILLDLVMPEIDGLEVLQQLKLDDRTKDIPVVVLTGKGKMEDREKSILLGADQFISKPMELRDIVDQVKKYFSSPG